MMSRCGPGCQGRPAGVICRAIDVILARKRRATVQGGGRLETVHRGKRGENASRWASCVGPGLDGPCQHRASRFPVTIRLSRLRAVSDGCRGAGVGPVVGRAPGAVKQPGKIDTDGTTARNAGRMARNRSEEPCHRRKAREGGGCGAVQGAVPYAGWRRRSRNGWMTPRDDAILIGGLDGFDEFDGRVLVTGPSLDLGVR